MLHLGRVGLARFDEVVLGETDGLPLIERGDVVHAVLLDRDRALIVIAVAAREAHLLAVVEDEEAVRQRPIGHDVEIGARAFDRPQIAAALFDWRPSARSRTGSGR